MGRSLFLTFIALLTIGCAAEGQDAQAAPKMALTGRVVDGAAILSPEFEQRMTARLAALEQETKVQLVVATTPNLEGRDIATYALDLANGWGLGDRDRDDGLLLLVAPHERKVRIEVGRGLEASVRDEDAATIIRDDILPHFREGQFETGIDNGVEGLAREVTLIPMKAAA